MEAFVSIGIAGWRVCIKYVPYSESLLLSCIKSKIRKESWLSLLVVSELMNYTYVSICLYTYMPVYLYLSIHPPFKEYFPENILELCEYWDANQRLCVMLCKQLKYFWPNWFCAYDNNNQRTLDNSFHCWVLLLFFESYTFNVFLGT